jgi:hypothetical protein
MSVPLSELGPPTPSPKQLWLPPLGSWGGGAGDTHSLAGEGVGGPNSDD